MKTNILQLGLERLVFILVVSFATGESQQSLTFNYRIGKATLSKIVTETSQAIYEALKGQFLKTHSCREEWIGIAKEFADVWDFPHCLDDQIECPKLTGTN